MAFGILALTAAGATSARADGFVCDSVNENLRVRVYNHTLSEDGTRNPAVMVISDTTVGQGRKTIAKFEGANGSLTADTAFYDAKVDLRRIDSRRKGELIGGTKLGQLDHIKLDVLFSYADPLEAGEQTDGSLLLEKRNGDVIQIDMVCERYLKSE